MTSNGEVLDELAPDSVIEETRLRFKTDILQFAG